MLPLTVADHIRETILDYLKTTFRLSDKAVEASPAEFCKMTNRMLRDHT